MGFQSESLFEDSSLNNWIVKETNLFSNNDRSISLLFLGDIAFNNNITNIIEKNGSEYLFSKLPHSFFDCDIVVFNLECCLSTRGCTWEPKPIHMRGRKSCLDIFPRKKQIYIANISNNHFLDYGQLAAIDTINALNQYNIRNIGGSGKIVDKQPIILETDEGTVAFLAFAPSAHSIKDSDIVNISNNNRINIINDVKDAKNIADIVIVSLHQGIEYSHYVDSKSRNLSISVLDAGADAVVCHHTHVIQAIEKRKNGTIFHGIGNFVIDIDLSNKPHARYSLALRMEIVNGKITRTRLEPFWMNENIQPTPVYNEEYEQLVEHVTDISGMLNTKLGVINNNYHALQIKIMDQFQSILEMYKRVGLRKTISYYMHRIYSKIINLSHS